MLRKIRNNIVVARSVIIGGGNPITVIEELREKVNPSSRHTEREINVRRIKNGNDFFYVADGTSSGKSACCFGNPKDYDATEFYEVVRTLSVKSDNGICDMHIYANTVTHKGFFNAPAPRKVDIDHRMWAELDPNTDINDINAVRFQLENNSKMAHFIDKFVIVSDEEKKAYKEYAQIQQIKLEQAKKIEALKAKREALEEKNRQKELNKQYKEKQKLDKRAVKLKMLADRKFLGR